VFVCVMYFKENIFIVKTAVIKFSVSFFFFFFNDGSKPELNWSAWSITLMFVACDGHSIYIILCS
jgi:hypothetical protein